MVHSVVDRSLKKALSVILAGVLLTLLLGPSFGFAQERPAFLNTPVLTQKHLMNQAIQLKISPRGLRFFETGLVDLLSAQGISLEEAYHAGFSWTADRSYKFDDLSIPQEQRDLLKMVSQLMTKWLVGFSFQEFRPSVQIEGVNYVALFRRFAIIPNESLLRQLGKKEGAVLSLEMEIQDLRLSAQSITMEDKNNQFLGKVGVSPIGVGIDPQSPPLKVKIPFYIRINEKKELEFEALQFDSNIESVLLNIEKPSKVLVPRIAIEINGHRFEMSQKQLETEVNDRLPEILKQAKSFLHQFSTQQLPEILNQKSKELLAGGLEEVSKMAPVGSTKNPCLPPDTEYLWGLKVLGIGMNNGLDLQLGAFVEDPLAPNTPLNPQSMASGKLNLDNVDPFSYDIALAIDRGFINRMLQLSYHRGLFSNLPIDKSKPNGPKMDLVKPPELAYVSPPANTVSRPQVAFIKMKTRARIQKGFLSMIQKIALKEPFELEMDVIVKMIKAENGDLKMFYHDIIPSSVTIDAQYVRLASDTVHKNARESLAEIAKKWRETGAALTDDPLPIPTEIGGVHLHTQHLSFHPSGHLVLFMNYAKAPRGPNPPASVIQCPKGVRK